ncbi:MAG: DeoR/GlpR family DNA-binding transcription regulator [Fusobacteriaceae bacterium]|jgi:DeoR family fructose operon transcriptional repressor|nr:DeoR/GlpR family DNA-binding transcription regulator [Fusobacteriaceae bacterium]
MLAEERKKLICELTNEKKAVRITELSQRFNVTHATIRRDLDELQNENKLRRTHGGAVALYPVAIDYVISELSQVNLDKKQRIAAKAYDTIFDNDTILMDGSSTVLELCRLIAAGDRKRLIVLTNALSVSTLLAGKEGVTVIIIGGEVKYHINSAVGKIAERTLRDIRVDKTYIGVNGIDLEYGYSITNFDEAAVKKAMIKCAKQAFVLADHSKFGRSYLAKVAEPEGEIDYLITDSRQAEFDWEALQEKVNLITTDD